MQEEAVLKLALGGEIRRNDESEPERQRGHTLRVTPGLVVPELERGRERADGGPVRVV